MMLSDIHDHISPLLLSGSTTAEDIDILHLLTDSRSLTDPDSTLFFAIPTSGNDGHKFIPSLVEAGVRAFVVNRIPEEFKARDDISWLVVTDTLEALRLIGKCHADFNGELLAITGSRGKTTLKEWIFQLMEPLANIARSPRSFNSQIGVPLSLWEIKDTTDLAIIEAGISKKGEMARLRDCIEPDTVILTNIGDAHSEGFGSDEEKTLEKLILAEGDYTKCLIFSADSDIISRMAEQRGLLDKALRWSAQGKEAEIQIDFGEQEKGFTEVNYSFKGISGSFLAPINDKADHENCGHALSFMLHCGVSPHIITERFKGLHKIGTRLNVSDGVNGCSVILDQYTSDFSSLRPAIDFMRRRRTPDQSATLVLSDLHHEDIATPKLYEEIAALVRKSGISRFIGVGPVIGRYCSLFADNSLFFQDTSHLLEHLSPSDFSDEIILLKGSPEYNFSRVAQMLEARTHETVLEVNLDAIISNYNYFRRHVPASVGMVCMVKASGYGAGSYEIAKTLQDSGAAYLAVAVVDEGIELRRKGITMPIMVMNPKVANYRLLFANRLEPNIYTFDMLRDLIREAEKNGIKDYPVHIKLDTGMHRMGFVEEELPALMDILGRSPEVRIKSAFSHLATADCPDMNDYTKLQLDRFALYTDFMLSKYPHRFLRHILNSAGILRFPDHHYDMVRLGIGLYGANTLPPDMEKPLAPVSTLRTVIIALREWEAGESVGYARKGMLGRKSRIATIPIGYADGMNRHFGRGNISVLVNGQWAPTVGNICMDATMIDVTGIDCRIGDSVEIFGRNAPLQRLADSLDTIPYEILTSVSPRVKRVYYRE